MTRDRVDQLLSRNTRILVVGEMILDEFIWGKVSRISPEAPVPVVEVVKESYNAGGAANVARNLRELIDYVHMLALEGHDRDANMLRELLVEQKIDLDCVETD